MQTGTTKPRPSPPPLNSEATARSVKREKNMKQKQSRLTDDALPLIQVLGKLGLRTA